MRQYGCTGFRRGALRVAFLAHVLYFGFLIGAAAAQSNPIVVENQQPGSADWDLPPETMSTDAVGQIKGYASAVSVNKGEDITFHVSVNPAQAFTIDVYRIGWYQGLGGRLMTRIGPLDGTTQPACPMDATTGMIECQWAASYTLSTQASWTSGVYLAVLTNAQAFRNYIIFVVRDDTRIAALLYQQPVATYQAYNNYPDDGVTGKSLYDFNSYGVKLASTGSKEAAKVSFDRPYSDGGIDDGVRSDYGEVNFIRWIERSGYDVTYSTDVDTHANGSRLLNYRGFLSVGHDEYWSRPMYDAVVAARDAGVNLGFFGADAVYWQIRFESSSGGVSNRVVVCYKDVDLDPIADQTLKTINWRDPVLNRPEQTLMGVQYVSSSPVTNPGTLVISNSGSWVYDDTGFKDGDALPGLVGYEADGFQSAFPSPDAVSGTYTLLSRSPWGTGPTDFSNTSVYQAQSGAWVFASGSMDWNWALDTYGHGYNVADTRLQLATGNVIDRFLAATMTSPASGTSFGGSSVTFAWRPAGGAASYWLEVGPTVGSNDYFGQSVGLATSQTVSALPLLGGPIFVRLWTARNGRWQFNDYRYAAFNPGASMTSPAPGSNLGGASVTFTWTAGTTASAYWLEAGTTVGAHDIFGQGTGLATSQLVGGLPTWGRPVYVRLWTQFHGTWLFTDYSYTAFNAKAVMTSPASGSALAGANVTFAWSTGIGATSYWLEVGTTAGAHDLFGASMGVATSRAVTGLPIAGGPIYVRLWTLLNGRWRFSDYNYTSFNAVAVMTSPQPGSGLGDTTATFTWSAGAGGSAYWLEVGTTAGAHDLFGQNVGVAKTQTVSGLPRLGGPLFARLWTELSGSWIFNDYTYTAVDARASMTTPTPGLTLGTGTVTFTWNQGLGASAYWLDVGTAAGSHDLFGQSVGLSTSQAVTGLPTLGNVYVRLWTLFGATWEYKDYVYGAAGT
jgi:hypothetical protein